MVDIIGFTTINRQLQNSVLQNKDIAIRDLLNSFYTKKGERINRPEFGSIIPVLIFDTLTDDVIDAIRDDVVDIVEKDIRWRLNNVEVLPTENGILCNVDVTFKKEVSPTQLVLKYNLDDESL